MGKSSRKSRRMSINSEMLLLPLEMREKIYNFLEPMDFLNLRRVCRQLYWECNTFGRFDVYVQERCCNNPTQISFSNVRFLAINTKSCELPLGRSNSYNVDRILLRDVSFSTLSYLGSCSLKLKQANLKWRLFTRPVPELKWTLLNYLQIQFHVPQDRDEFCMLDNLDSLFEQKFCQLRKLVITYSNARFPNLQSRYGIRTIKFVSKHWETLKEFNVTMDCRPCFENIRPVNINNSKPSFLSQGELNNLPKVQLTSLYLSLSEVLCPSCDCWRTLIQQQRTLKRLHILLSTAAYLPTLFFCNPTQYNQFASLKTLTIMLWGMVDYFPLDFRYLASAQSLKALEIGRHASLSSRVTLPKADLLNVDVIPTTLVHLNLSGYLINESDIPILLSRLNSVRNFSLTDCGTRQLSEDGERIGFTTINLPDLACHPTITHALIDFNFHPSNEYNSEKSLEGIRNCLRNYTQFEYHWKYLYDVRFELHRFEFHRRTIIGQLLPFNFQSHATCTHSQMSPATDFANQFAFVNNFDDYDT